MNPGLLANYVDGQWSCSTASEALDVENPATGEILARVPLSNADDIGEAVQAAEKAFATWRHVPVGERVQYLFKLRDLLERHMDELARTITLECGKTLAEARAEIRRGIENVEAACGLPSLIQGYNNENVAAGIDEHLFRQPIGIVAAITPFNFPAMIPLWFLPFAIACGNAFLLKPSDKVPLTGMRIFELLESTGLPHGVAQLIHGARETVEAIIDHPAIAAVSFVGSSPVARYVYERAAARGKRAQCQGGAKNPVIIMPDADLDLAVPVVMESAFGCAGQRCLAASLAVAVADTGRRFVDAVCSAAGARRVGSGLDEGVEMGPVITQSSKIRIEGLIGRGRTAGARLTVDGRGKAVSGHPHGHFLSPTVLEAVAPESELAVTEIFGPVLGVVSVDSLAEAISVANRTSYGNMACLFTSSGAAARRFRNEVAAGNIGINVGVAAPMAYYPFSGWKQSFFGDLHAQGRHAVEFYTQTKVVVERWPSGK